uniref:Secreted protein n=1 Tax=Schizaphis graminum TaxID=13262 RepID=A0A2S2P7H3_SCHGA
MHFWSFFAFITTILTAIGSSAARKELYDPECMHTTILKYVLTMIAIKSIHYRTELQLIRGTRPAAATVVRGCYYGQLDVTSAVLEREQIFFPLLNIDVLMRARIHSPRNTRPVYGRKCITYVS